MKNHLPECPCTMCKILNGEAFGKNAINYKHGKTHNNKCIDCGTHISFSSKRCRPCGQKHRYEDVEKLITYCVDCGKKIDNYSKRCQVCYWKNLLPTLISGQNNHNWIKDRSLIAYSAEFNYELKESIRKRDNYTCQNPECNMTEEEHKEIFGQALHVHHIDYNKKNCKEENLLTLCLRCNVRANYKRSYWQRYYELKISKMEVTL